MTEPMREKRFSLTYVDPRGRSQDGVFLYHRPSLQDLLRIEAEKARLLEGQVVEKDFLILAFMMARLKVVLREVPAWLRWDEVEDVGLVTRLTEEVDRLEGDWFRGDDARGGSPGAGAREAARAERAAPAAAVVGGQVPPAADQR
jgi:hypothetical protein